MIDNDRLAAIGASCYATGTEILDGLREALERLRYIDEVTKEYSNPETKGATAADCQAFIANELKHVPATHGLETTMRRRMYNATLQKLVELGMWRAAIDAKRFQDQREAENRRREEIRRRDEEILRRERENILNEKMRKAQEDLRKQSERMKAEAERRRRESAAGSDRDARSRHQSNPFGEGFGDDFASDFWSSFNPDEDFRKAWRSQYDKMYEGTYSNRAGGQKSQGPGPKARNKDQPPWHKVLGVPPNADKATIKSAWRNLASSLHPDKPENRNDPVKLEKLKNINTAKDEGLRGLLL
jgi:hypothetical protein